MQDGQEYILVDVMDQAFTQQFSKYLGTCRNIGSSTSSILAEGCLSINDACNEQKANLFAYSIQMHLLAVAMPEPLNSTDS